MPQRIREFCRDTGQPVPSSMGEVVRCALDSLALCYRATVEDLDEMLGRRHDPIHIVGAFRALPTTDSTAACGSLPRIP